MTNFQRKVLELIDEGLAVAEISKKLNCSTSSVSSVLKRFNVKAKKVLNKNSIDHNYFDIIDTEHKAYFLGFIIADGSIASTNKSGHNGGGRFSINIQKEDEYILEKLKMDLNSNGKITTRIYNSGVTNRKPQCSFRWTSMEMALTLEKKYNIKSNKTYDFNFEFPFDQIPKIYLGSFIRGFIDGDGCFESNKGKFTPSIVGTSKTWILQIGELISKETGLVYKIYEHKGKTCTYYSLRWSAERKDKLIKITKLYEFLYKDSTIFLKRKRDKIESYLEYRVNQ